ncbi:ROK family transcriptional regulator [Oceanobacillus sp. Castelsardo]|uniref:ROK family transcriptional regulator n=1 Tax=Oceanobacillus sp. Castelsardo TaxID=1851204 RepID=UPI0008395549|nr:ROK family transcriptional regulator [Oceanobacillus sp. Castelsardo]
MKTGDASYIKQLNRKILIKEIIKNRSLSRSDLARITGLNKATVSSQVNDFIEEQIVIEEFDNKSNNRGRRPIILKINGMAGYSIGIDIDANHISVLFMNLNGKTFEKFSVEVQFDDLIQATKHLIDHLTPLVEKFNSIYHPVKLIGITVGIHGIVNDKEEIIFTPKQEWSNYDIKSQLEQAFHTKVYVDNNANLSVFAEQVFEDPMANLFCITLYSGIGLGIISENEIYRGYQGFAGEIGHMVVESNGLACPCGNKGCWELYASERALAEALNISSCKTSLENAILLPENKDILNEYLHYLAIGLNNIINIFNPEKIILNGAIIHGHFSLITEMTKRLHSKMNSYREIRLSKLGEYSCVLGGAAFALKNFYEIDTINFSAYGYFGE